MKKLFKEAYRSFHKKLSQYIGLILFLTVSVFTFTGLFSAIFQVRNGIEILTQKSKAYDFQINVADLYPNDHNNPKWRENDLADFNLRSYQVLQTKVINLKVDKNNNVDWSSWNDLVLPNEKGKEKITTIVNNFDRNVSAWLLSLAVKNTKYSDLEINKKVDIDIAFVHFFRFETVNAKNERQFFQAQLLTEDQQNCKINKANSIYCRDVSKVYSPSLEINPELNNGEVLISKQYAWKNGLKDNIFIPSLLGDKSLSFAIKGYSASFETISPQLVPMQSYVKNNDQLINLKNGAILYTAKADFDRLHSAFPNGSDSLIAYIKLNDDLSNAEKISYADKLLSLYFVSPDDNIVSFWRTLSGSIITTTNTSMLVIESITIVCSVIVAIILLFFIKKDVDSQKQQIGVLKALGYKKIELVVVFMFTIVWTSILSCAVGWALSIPLQVYFSNMNIFNISIIATPIYFNWKIIMNVLLVTPLLIMLLSFVACYINLNKDALSLIYNRENSKWHSWLNFQYFLKPNKPFWLKISSAFALKLIGKCFTVSFVFCFAAFLLTFQLNANFMTKEVIWNSFAYYKPDVKSFLVNTHDQLDLLEDPNQPDGLLKSASNYQWISESDFMKRFEANKLTFGNITGDDNVIDIPNPADCLFSYVKSESEEKLKTVCGDIKQIIDTLKQTKNLENHWLPSSQIEALINLRIKINDEYIENGWDELYHFVNIPLIKNFFESYNKEGLTKFLLFINTIKSVSHYTKGIYPNVYFGNWAVYDQDYDLPFILKTLRFNLKDTNKASQSVYKLSLVGLTDNQSIRENYFDFTSKVMSLDNLQKEVFDNAVMFNEVYKSKKPAIPAIMSKRLFQSGKYKVGKTIRFDVKVNSKIGYKPIYLKIAGYDEKDISSANIYVNEKSVTNLMRYYIMKYYSKATNTITFDFDNYHNAIMSKEKPIIYNGKVEKVVLQPFRIISLMALNGDYDFDADKFASANEVFKNFSVVNGLHKLWPTDTIRKLAANSMEQVSDQLIILEILTAIIVALILIIIIINMVLDENKRSILTMKVIGYKSKYVAFTVLGFYMFAVLIGYLISFVLAFAVWSVILDIIFAKTGMLLTVPFSLIAVLITSTIVFSILITVFMIGYKKIRNCQLTNITLI